MSEFQTYKTRVIKGFSTMEVSIVSAIVALVVIAATTGISVVKKSEHGSVITAYKQILEATVSFQTQYGGLPGDISDVSKLGDSAAGNGNGVLDTQAEQMQFWKHLSASGLLKGSLKGKYDGVEASVYNLGGSLPKGPIPNSGFFIRDVSDAQTSYSDIKGNVLVIDFTGISSTSNTLPILKPEDAKYIDESFDDGNPTTGDLRAVGSGTNCVNSSEYNVGNDNIACRFHLIVTLNGSRGDADEITGACSEIGATRESPNTSERCAVGQVGQVIETCRVDSDGVGSWEITSRNCEPIQCHGGAKYGETRLVRCINGHTGTGVSQSCNGDGIWQTDSRDCNPPAGSCPNIGEQRILACPQGQVGRIIQSCGSVVNGEWDGNKTWTTLSNNCANPSCGMLPGSLFMCQGSIVPMGTETYRGGVSISCATGAGIFQINSRCVPQYSDSGVCTEGDIKDIGCPVGETGKYSQICKASPDGNYWAKNVDTCKRPTCDGYPTGEIRFIDNEKCPDGREGKIFEVCRVNLSSPLTGEGEWVKSYKNCASSLSFGNPTNSICQGSPFDKAGFAEWPAADISTSGLSALRCIDGFVPNGSLPTRSCDVNGDWSTVTNPCVRAQCSAETINGAAWPLSNASDKEIVGHCVWPNYEGDPRADCNSTGEFENFKFNCRNSKLPVINSSLKHWFDADDPTTIFEDTSCTDLAESGDIAQCWKDKSGNASNASYSSGPTYRKNQINDRAVLEFGRDGASDYDRLDLDLTYLANRPYSIYMLYERYDSSDANYILGNFGGSVMNKSLHFGFLYNDTLHQAQYANGLQVTVPNFSTQKPQLISAVLDTLSGRVAKLIDDTGYYTNSKSDKTALISANNGNIGRGFQASQDANGSLGELIIYDTNLNNKDQAKVEHYLADKWGISVPDADNSQLGIWMDASDNTTVFEDTACTNNSENNDRTRCWADKGPHKRKFTTTSTNGPVYYHRDKNFKNTLQMTEDRLEASVPGGNITSTKYSSMYIVTKKGVEGNHIIRYINGSDTRYNLHLFHATDRTYWDFGGCCGSTGRITGTFDDSPYIDKWIIVSVDKNNTTGRIMINGKTLATNNGFTAGMSTGTSTVSIGYDMTGRLAELITYKEWHNDAENRSVLQYLGEKWGIPIPSMSDAPIQTGLQMHLDASDESSFASDDTCDDAAFGTDSTVGCWMDRTVNNNHATQSDDSRKPTLVTNATDHKVVNFNGTSQHMSHPTIGNYSSISAFVVLARQSVGPNREIFNRKNGGADFANGALFVMSAKEPFSTYVAGRTPNITYAAPTPVNINKLKILTATEGGSTSKLYVDGRSENSTTISPANQLKQLEGGLGARYSGWFFYGHMAEILVYSNVPTEDNRELTEQYLADKWGIDLINSATTAQIWLDASDITSLYENSDCSTGGNPEHDDNIECWKDKSGYARNATLYSGDGPLYKTNEINGKSALYFNADSLEVDTSFMVGSSYHLYFVHEKKTNGNHSFFFGCKDGCASGANQKINIGYTNNSTFTLDQWYNQIRILNGDFSYDGTPQTSFSSTSLNTSDGKKVALFENNRGYWSNSNTSTGPLVELAGTMVVGSGHSGNTFTGNIAEVVAYNRSLSWDERAQLEEYLGDKWGMVYPRVRRDDMSLWLDAYDSKSLYTNSDCSSGQSPSDNAQISCWKDKSTNKFEFTSTNASRPTYQHNEQNGKNIVRSTGVGLTSSSTRFDSLTNQEQGAIYAVAKTSFEGSNSVTIFRWDSGNSYRLNLELFRANGAIVWDSGTPCCEPNMRSFIAIGSDAALGKWMIVNADRNGNAGKIQFNGTTVFSTGSALTTTITASNSRPIQIGEGYQGDIAEILLYKNHHTDAENKKVREYLSDKWAIYVQDE